MVSVARFCIFFFFNDTATTEIYTLSLHDALPIWSARLLGLEARALEQRGALRHIGGDEALELLGALRNRVDAQAREGAGPGQLGHRRVGGRSEEHTSELQSPCNLVCRLLLEKKKTHAATVH